MQFLQTVEELQRVDLQIPTLDRMCFFLNIYSVLLLHGLLITGGSSKSRIQGLGLYGFYKRTCYQISGYRFSLSDIRDGILRNNKPYPGSHSPAFYHNTEANLNPRVALLRDPRIGLAINPEDPRILFLLNKIEIILSTTNVLRLFRPITNEYMDIEPVVPTETIESHRFINILSGVHPSSINRVLRDEAEDYCMQNITVKNDNIKLPTIFGVYAEDFGGSDEAIIKTCMNSLLPHNCLIRSQLMEMYSEKPETTGSGSTIQSSPSKEKTSEIIKPTIEYQE
jgi:hypothetical protein